MEDINKKKSKILITIGCIVIAIMLSIGTKTIIDYANKNLKEGVREEGPLGAEVVDCSNGQYRDGQTCRNCPVGYRCNGETRYACAAGTYASGGAAVCTECQEGYYCPGATTRLICEAGYSCLGKGLKEMQPCPEGSFCNPSVPQGVSVCPNGKWSDAGKPGATSAEQCYDCPAGYYCALGSKNECPEGTTSKAGSSLKTECYSDTISFSCPASMSMDTTDFCTLEPELPEGANVSLSSSNTAVLTASRSGDQIELVSKNRGGLITITVTVTINGKKTEVSKSIKVIGPNNVVISGPSSLETGGSAKFSATVSGVGDYDKTVEWDVSDGNDIDNNGNLDVGNKSGTITVTATVKGSDVKTSKNITVVCANGYVEVDKICEKNVPKTLVATLSGNSLYEGESVKVTKAIVTYLDGTEVDVTNNVSVSPKSPLTNPAKNTIYLPGSSSYNDGDTREYTVSYTEEDAKPVTTTGKITLKKLNNDEKKEVKSLKITGDTILLVGETSNLSVYPVYSDGTTGTTDISDKCKWMSSWSNVATVSGGTVKALTIGNTTAVASYSYSINVDGKNVTKTVAASASIVVKHENMPHSIEIDHKQIYLAKDGDSMVSTIKVLNTKGEPISGLNLSVSGNVYTDVSVSSSGDNYSVTTTSKSTGNVSDTIKICTGIDIATGSRLCVEYDAYIYCEKWNLVTGKMTFDNKYTKAHAHVKETCYYQSPPDKCEQKQDSSGKIVIECTEYYNRCCGNPSPSPKPDSTVKEACYIDGNGNYAWGNYSNDSRYNLVSNKLDRDTCLETPTKKEACYRDKDGIYEWTSTPPEGAVLMNGLDKDNCVAKPACYKNSANDYKWALTAPSGYTLVESIKEDINCKLSDAAACYKDEYNNYVWGDYKDYGYTVVSDIKSAEKCLAPAACYVDKNGEYVWGQYANDYSYVLVSEITSKDKCKKETPLKEACYIDKNGNYVWGNYADKQYDLISNILKKEDCKKSAPESACYKDKNGKYVWGNYANDTSYSKVDNVTKVEDCGENVIVPPTAANVSTVVYVAIAIMTIFGGGVVYYVYNKKKLESK